MPEQLTPELELEVEQRAQKRAAQIVKETTAASTLDGVVKDLRLIKRSLRTYDRKLRELDAKVTDGNHLRETLATREDLKAALAGTVVVSDLGAGEYSVRFGDVVLGPEDLDELPLALRASRSARASAAEAKQSAEAAAAISTLRSLWVTAVACAASALFAGLTILGGAYVFLRATGRL